MRRLWIAGAALTLVGAVLLLQRLPAVNGAAGQTLRLVQSIALPGVGGRIDHMAIDAKGHRLFIAALGNGTVEVIDTSSGRRVRSITGLREPQGVAYVEGARRLFVACGGSGNCEVYDAATFQRTASVALGDDADNARYDAVHGNVIVGYGRGALAVIKASNARHVADVTLPSHPESFQLEPDGRRAYVNLPQSGRVAVVDMVARRVAATWTVAEAGDNFPMALDSTGYHLFVGCRRPARLLVYDTRSGRQVAAVPIAGDADDIFYDAARKRLYISGGAGEVSVIRRDGPDAYTVVENTATAPGARTSLFTPGDGRLYVAVPRHGLRSAEIRVYAAQP